LFKTASKTVMHLLVEFGLKAVTVSVNSRLSSDYSLHKLYRTY
jgi:hypothetical protein